MTDEHLKELHPGESFTLESGAEVSHRDSDARLFRVETADGVIDLSSEAIEDLAALAGRVSQPRPEVWLAYNGRAYGKAFSELDAVVRFAYEHGRGNLPDTVTVTVIQGRGDLWTTMQGAYVGAQGDHMDRAERFEVPRESFEALLDAVEADRSEVAADAALADAERETLDLDE